MQESAHKSPAEIIIERCGGTRALASALPPKNGRPFPPSTVQSWKTAGLIPAQHQPDVIQAATALGVTVVPADFFPAPHGEQTAAPGVEPQREGEAA